MMDKCPKCGEEKYVAMWGLCFDCTHKRMLADFLKDFDELPDIWKDLKSKHLEDGI